MNTGSLSGFLLCTRWLGVWNNLPHDDHTKSLSAACAVWVRTSSIGVGCLRVRDVLTADHLPILVCSLFPPLSALLSCLIGLAIWVFLLGTLFFVMVMGALIAMLIRYQWQPVWLLVLIQVLGVWNVLLLFELFSHWSKLIYGATCHCILFYFCFLILPM